MTRALPRPPAPAPAKRAAIPVTADPATAAPGIAAAIGSALSALGIARRRR